MSDTSLGAGQGGLTQEWLESYIDHRLSIHKSTSEIEDELMELGLVGETAGTMVRNAENSQWLAEGGGGPALARVGPVHMIMGTLLMVGGAASTYASYYFVINFDAPVAFIFYGAVGAGAADFVYGLIRFLDG